MCAQSRFLVVPDKRAFAMPKYRRVKIAGGCFFFTVCLADRRATTLVDHIDDLKAAWRWTQERMPFSSPAWVILPDHIHCIWKLPPDDDNYALRWSFLKRHFTRAMGQKTTSLISVATPSASASSNILKTGRIQAFMRAMGDMVEPALGLWISTAGVGSDGAFQAGNAPLLLRSMS